MAGSIESNKLRESWDRLVLLLVSRPAEGWERVYDQVARREIERLVVPASKDGRDE